MSTEDHHVLCPLDGSEHSACALAGVLPLLRACGSRVTLLGALADGKRMSEVEGYLSKARAALQDLHISASFECRPGPPAEEILSCAREGTPDLIAMASSGRTGIRRIFHRSVAEEVLRHSEVPLLLCRPDQRLRDWRKILAPVDEETPSEDLLSDLSFLAGRTGASVELFHAERPLLSYPLFADAMMGMVHAGSVRTSEPTLMREIVDKLIAAGIPAGGTSRQAPRISGLLERAFVGDFDLVCLATPVRKGWSRLLRGDDAEEILRRSPCPVFVRPVRTESVRRSGRLQVLEPQSP